MPTDLEMLNRGLLALSVVVCFVTGLYKAFSASDASLLEINPALKVPIVSPSGLERASVLAPTIWPGR